MPDTKAEADPQLPTAAIVGKSACGGIENPDCGQWATMTGQHPQVTLGKERKQALSRPWCLSETA